jgi:hypothetical protein
VTHRGSSIDLVCALTGTTSCTGARPRKQARRRRLVSLVNKGSDANTASPARVRSVRFRGLRRVLKSGRGAQRTAASSCEAPRQEDFQVDVETPTRVFAVARTSSTLRGRRDQPFGAARRVEHSGVLRSVWTPVGSAWTPVWSAWIPVGIGGKYPFRDPFQPLSNTELERYLAKVRVASSSLVSRCQSLPHTGAVVWLRVRA